MLVLKRWEDLLVFERDLELSNPIIWGGYRNGSGGGGFYALRACGGGRREKQRASERKNM